MLTEPFIKKVIKIRKRNNLWYRWRECYKRTRDTIVKGYQNPMQNDTVDNKYGVKDS